MSVISSEMSIGNVSAGPCIFMFKTRALPSPELATLSISTVFSACGRGFVFSFLSTSVILHRNTKQ